MSSASTPAVGASPTHGAPMNRRGLGLLSLGHFTVDINQGGLPVLLPFLFFDLGLSYTTAALVITVAALTSSVIQPLFGYAADRLARRWLLPLACFLACAALALASLAPSYPVLLALVVVSSLGIAMFHPEAARLANLFAGARKVSGMALYVAGGNLGFATGPALLGALLTVYGRPGALGLLALALGVPALLLLLTPLLVSAPAAAGQRSAGPRGASRPAAGRSMGLLIAVITCRQWAQANLLTFLPLYVVNHLGESPAVASQKLAALMFGSVVGTLLSGPLGDRWGAKPVITTSLFVATPLLLVVFGSSGPLTFVVLFLAGTALVMTLSATVVLAQALMPDRTALAAGLTLGLGVGLGSVGSALLGRLADTIGLAPTVALFWLPPLLGALLSLALPNVARGASAPARVRAS